MPLLPSSKVDLAYDRQLDRVFQAFTDVAQAREGAGASLDFLERACTARYGFWADRVRHADLVVFQAEGTMGMGTNFTRGPRLMLLPFVAKHAWGRKVISLNQSFYSHDARIRQNAAEAFASFDFAAFREGASVALARASGVTQAAYVPDVAFLSPMAEMARSPLQPGQGYFRGFGVRLEEPSPLCAYYGAGRPHSGRHGAVIGFPEAIDRGFINKRLSAHARIHGKNRLCRI